MILHITKKHIYFKYIWNTYKKTDTLIGNKTSLKTHQRINIPLTSLEKNNMNNFKTYIGNE